MSTPVSSQKSPNIWDIERFFDRQILFDALESEVDVKEPEQDKGKKINNQINLTRIQSLYKKQIHKK